MNLLAISSGGEYIVLPTPSSYNSVPQEIVKSGRNTAGTLYKERITVKQTITVGWNALPPEDKNRILSLTAGNSFNVAYFDTQDGEVKFGLFYRGNDLDVQPLVRFNGTEFVAYNISMSLVEF